MDSEEMPQDNVERSSSLPQAKKSHCQTFFASEDGSSHQPSPERSNSFRMESIDSVPYTSQNHAPDLEKDNSFRTEEAISFKLQKGCQTVSSNESEENHPSSSLEKSNSYRLEMNKQDKSNNESTRSLRANFQFLAKKPGSIGNSFRPSDSAKSLNSSARSFRRAIKKMGSCSFRLLKDDSEAGMSEEDASLLAERGGKCLCLQTKVLFALGLLLSIVGIYFLVKKMSQY